MTTVRFRVSSRPVHLTAGWRWLVWDNETLGFVEAGPEIDPNGYPTAEMAQAAIDALPEIENTDCPVVVAQGFCDHVDCNDIGGVD